MTTVTQAMVNSDSKKSIVIFAFSRADLLRECIRSVMDAEESANWNKILVHQLGHLDVQ